MTSAPPDPMLGTDSVSAPAPRLEIRNLRRFFDGRAVVDDVSLQIQAGQVTCLLGPSGCGKSTTLRMIAGVEMQDSGEIYVDGKLICDTVFRVPPERREIGLMFQDFALFPHLSVADNVAFGLKGSKDEKRARVEELLQKVSLAQYIDEFPHQLSGGEQQRVALARALAPRPRIMLMDEPFSGLDNRLRDGIRDETLTLLKEEDAAVLLVTHEPEEAMRMADEIALMRSGKIVQQGAPYNVYTRPVDRAAVGFFSDTNVLQAEVNGALAETPFGQFLAPGVPDGTAVDIVFRPQHLRIDFDRNGRGPHPTPSDGVAARGVVKRARFLGHESLVEFRMDFDGSVLKATVPNVFLPDAGRVMWLTVRRNRCFVFPTGG
ncbi:ABC transporter ATP-binding protein [Phaeobacter gallaeciensis]|uniref:Putrescine transport ATP-binding protein n=1 Tax=Phaeobacter gallaeciensis TaxID=60890 RepID=A0AAC9ZAI9_9RHOB|nr:ABC transporter ATP-binding protein [Phaeobacter gallaeciensis]AHD10170.1 ABC-type spermidine/putrescine transport system, ATPase component [Phaeobacter gallaeciensis DSM 26640]ATE93434.1 putative putrescine transport ATP-binding protein [Phaeobacter gallaeciensis]ATE96745.1 putative putrescine transport ATP-binding protein [Phaeobacter gallaeciensis]ATF02098.1 putative putrescine transport ATP-binding protein [Phaeobacter gallaeciensis]ATF06478.1 putative putrescine transport ATP-binding p